MTKEEKYNKLVLDNFNKELSKMDLYYFNVVDRYWWVNEDYELLFAYENKTQKIIYYGWGNKFKSSLCLEDNEFETLMRRYIGGKFGVEVKSIYNEYIEYDNYVVRETILLHGKKIND